MAMRVHITLEEDLVKELDRRVGPRRRSSFIAEAVNSALEDAHRWELIESALGSVPETGQAWGPDPRAWVRRQRRGDNRRVG